MKHLKSTKEKNDGLLTLGKIEEKIKELKNSYGEIIFSEKYNLSKLRNNLATSLTNEKYSINRDMDSIFIKLYNILDYDTIQKYSEIDIATYDDIEFLDGDSCCIFCFIGFYKSNFINDYKIN
jgi:hypothetical protein